MTLTSTSHFPRIDACFHQCREQHRSAFIPYIMGGDPYGGDSVALMHRLADAGADIIELGAPFSDPAADGPTIQEAGLRSLQAGTRLIDVLGMCREFRSDNTHTPIIIMGYANPVLQYGYARFAEDAANAGADGVIIVDLPMEEEGEITSHLRDHAIALIRLIAPTTQPPRLAELAGRGEGFVYSISIKGITGTTHADSNALTQRLADVQTASPVPVVAGFGISTPEQAAALAPHCSGIVVGSALINALAQAHEAGADPLETAATFSRAMATAMYG